MAKFTIFVRPEDDVMSIWIVPAEGQDLSEAKEECLANLEDNIGLHRDNVNVIGITRGELDIVEWDDSEEGIQ